MNLNDEDKEEKIVDVNGNSKFDSDNVESIRISKEEYVREGIFKALWEKHMKSHGGTSALKKSGSKNSLKSHDSKSSLKDENGDDVDGTIA